MNDLLDLPEKKNESTQPTDIPPAGGDYDISDFNTGTVDLSDIPLPNLGFLKGLHLSPTTYVALAILIAGITIYKKRKRSGGGSVINIPFMGGSKYQPKKALRPDYSPAGKIVKLSWGNTFDNGIVAVCDKTGDLFVAGGDGDFGGHRYGTAILRCKRGKNPQDTRNWSLVWGGPGKCYGLTVVDGDPVGIISDHGSMWEGATNWRIRNFRTGEKSDRIDTWFGHSRVGQFSFLNGKTDGTAHIYFLRAKRERFVEFGDIALHTTIKRNKFKYPSRIKRSDFGSVTETPGLRSGRRSSSGYYYAVQVDVYAHGKGIVASLGEYVTANIYRYEADSPTGPFDRVVGHQGFGGIPHGRHIRRGSETYTVGIFTNSICYFNDSFWCFMSGSHTSDGIYCCKVK